MEIYAHHIYTPTGCINGRIRIENGIFQEIEETKHLCDETYADCRILPGFIDLHTHGYRGYHAQSLDRQDLQLLKEVMPRVGVTSFLPTAGAHFAGEYENLECLADVIERQEGIAPHGADMLGIHMEGPFLNPQRRGAFQREQLLPIDIAKAQQYLKAARGHIRYMALSPELPNCHELIHYLRSHDVVVAGAHTCATYEEFTQGIQAGIAASTHTGNGMTQMDRREVGALGAALLDDTLYCEVICDLHHINCHMLNIMFRIKRDGCRRFIMISDSTEVSGYAPGSYQSDGMQVKVLQNGLILDADGTIMGSTYGMLDGFRNMKNVMKLAVEDILMMTSYNPAKLLHMDAHKGSIMEGMDADFIILDRDDQLIQTFVRGVCVYDRAKDSDKI